MREVRLSEADMMDGDPEELKAQKLDEDYYDRLFDDGDVRVRKPNGDLLAVVVRGAVSDGDMDAAYKSLREVAVSGGKSDGNRFTATGEGSRENRGPPDERGRDYVPKEISPNTGIAGYMDRQGQMPYCRQTAFNAKNTEEFGDAIPMIRACAEVFQQYGQDRYDAQRQVADRTEDEWIISGTPFTTLTVNLNWQTACHKDAGDYEEGFGVMTVARRGDYDGAYYIQPEYRTAYDLRDGDVILSDVHEWHGNGPFRSSDGYYERLSMVLYYREKMTECGTPEEELERAKEARDL